MTKESRIYNAVDTASSIGDAYWTATCKKYWTATCERIKLEHFLRLHTKKKNSKWIKDLNVRLDTIKPLEEYKGKTLFDINCRKIIFYPPSRIIK